MTEHEEFVPQDDAIIGVAFRWSLVVIAIVAIVVVGVVFFLRGGEEVPVVIDRPPVVGPGNLVQDAADRPDVTFADVTSGAGIDFVHTSGARGEKLLPETMGSGAAFFDFDGDGDQDLVFNNARDWPHSAGPGAPATPALYANDGAGSFTNVTAGSGLDASLYGTGVACGDLDNDGHADVFLTAVGPDRLYRGAGDGTFEDMTAGSGVAGDSEGWSSSAGFLDYDDDGDLDLFVCRYIKWSRDIDLRLNFSLNGKDRAYGPPTQYEGTFCALYRNDGEFRFTDVSETSGVRVANPTTQVPMGKALAVTFVDVDTDGALDILVANDTVQNFVFRNNGDGTFEEVGAASGIAFDTMGNATGAMGMDAADFGNRGRLGVGIANFANESSSFYVQQGDGAAGGWQFADMAGAEGIGSPSRLKLSFGLFFFDYDLDGRLDLLQANGHLEDEINQIQSSQHYEQPAQLFWNCGADAKACFAAVPEDAVGDLSRPIVGRGAAYADIDADGDPDVLLTQSGGAPMLLRNDQAQGHRWLAVKLVGNGTTSNRDAIGARIELTAGGITQRRQVMPTRSYLSQVALPVTFGLGNAERVESLRVTWPDGTTQSTQVTEVDRRVVIAQE